MQKNYIISGVYGDRKAVRDQLGKVMIPSDLATAIYCIYKLGWSHVNESMPLKMFYGLNYVLCFS